MRLLVLVLILFMLLITGAAGIVLDSGMVQAASGVTTASNGPNATTQDSPVLSLPDLVTAQPGDQVTLPISYTANGHAISSLTFSIDYDQTLLSLDPTDSDEDGTPDAVLFNVPPAFSASATLNTADTDGELDITIFDPAPPLVALSSRIAVSLTFAVLTPTTTTDAVVAFSQDPPASFGSITGQSVPGVVDGGIIRITVPTALPPTDQPVQSDKRVFLPVVIP